MHAIHTTDGVVLHKRSGGEANTSVAILSRDRGLVWAMARSARKEVSKLRYGLEPLTRGRFSLVEGRYEWKLVGIEDVSRAWSALPQGATARLGRISRLLMRLVQGEEPVPALYDTVVAGFDLVSHTAPSATAESVECVLVLRILAHLGYLPQTPELAPFIEDSLFSLAMAEEVERSKAFLIRTINQSLEATGL